MNNGRLIVGEEITALSNDLKIFIKWVLASLIDTSFLITWAFIQYYANQLISDLQLSGIDIWVFSAFQAIFAISTLLPVMIYIVKDIYLMYLRARKEVQAEHSSITK